MSQSAEERSRNFPFSFCFAGKQVHIRKPALSTPEVVPERKRSTPINPANTIRKCLSNNPVSQRPFRDRIIHLLALRPYKKLEVLARLQRDGINQKDRNSLGTALQQVFHNRRFKCMSLNRFVCLWRLTRLLLAELPDEILLTLLMLHSWEMRLLVVEQYLHTQMFSQHRMYEVSIPVFLLPQLNFETLCVSMQIRWQTWIPKTMHILWRTTYTVTSSETGLVTQKMRSLRLTGSWLGTQATSSAFYSD